MANLYSEKLAWLAGIEEQDLLEQHPNVQCLACHMIYKRRWFDEWLLQALFTGAVALHPKGWDVVLGRFHPDNFKRTFDGWALAHRERHESAIRRAERELISFLDSISLQADSFDRAVVMTALRSGDVNAVRPMVDSIAAAMTEPAPFKRFSGFRSAAVWEYLRRRLGPIDSYAEVGCPLWGLLSVAAEFQVPATYLQRQEINYWGQGCQHQGMHCLTKALLTGGVTVDRWQNGARYQVVGLLQYLDHLRYPGEFLQEVFSRADSALVVLDAVDQPVAIQHFTGWTDQTLYFAAEKFDKQLHQDFDSIRPSGNVLYLLAPR